MAKRPSGQVRGRSGYVRLLIGRSWWEWWWWKGWGCSVPRRLDTPPDPSEPVRQSYRGYVNMAKRPQVESIASGGEVVPVEVPKLLAKFPHIADYLCSPAWDDGVAKTHRQLFIFLDGPLVKLLLKVGPPSLKMMVSARSWDDAWSALEALLKSGQAPWEDDHPREVARGKKGK